MIRPGVSDFLLTRAQGLVWRLLCLGPRGRAHSPADFQPAGFVRLQSPLTDERGNTAPCRTPWGRRGSLEQNGCGPVAAYNLLHGFGLPVTLPGVVDALEQGGAAAAGGRLGASPGRIAAFLRAQGCTIRRFSGGRRGWRASCGADGLLVLYRHPHGMHYVSALRGADGRFTFWNDALCVPSPWRGTPDGYRARLRASCCRPHELVLVSRPANEPPASQTTGKDAE